jgi:hypothetical protein
MRREAVKIYFLTFLVLFSAMSVEANALPQCLSDAYAKLTGKKTSTVPPPEKARSRFSEDLAAREAMKHMTREERQEAMAKYKETYPAGPYDRAIAMATAGTAGLLTLKAALAFAEHPWGLPAAMVLVPGAWWLADAGSQIFHKWLDSFASDTHPIWGGMTRAFRVHHELPLELTKNDYGSTIKPTALLMSPFVAANFFIGSPEWSLATTVFLMGAIHSVEAHRQAHIPKPGAIVKFLQDWRIIVTKDDHNQHHGGSNDKHFATLNSWATPFFESLNIWRRADMFYWNRYGVMPTNWVAHPSSIPPDVKTKLTADLDKIPPEMWGIKKAFPQRVPEELKEPIDQAEIRWRDHYIKGRREDYLLQAQTSSSPEAAREAWLKEQTAPENQWVYRGEVRPLYEEAEGKPTE